ncbi:cyclic nucleotide-binding-like protein [Melampsora americana]|nr:cyclic nucleotide-binding-like protein [Melampsora americana]
MPHQPTHDPRVQPPSSSSSEASDESESAEPPMVPSGYNFGRRTSVSAESLSPSNLNSGVALPKVVIPKTIEQRSRIESSIKENLLFRNLDEEQYNDVLNAMSELKVNLGTEVIVQGGVGDFFYVVEEGTFDVYVRGPATYTYVPPIANGLTGTLSIPIDQQSQQDPILQRAQTPVGGTTVTHQAPAKKVHSYGPGGSFGELALMYNAPRAATVIATSQSATLWALDRVTFRSILMEHTSRKRKMYESFLSTVPILASLTPGERSKIADSLEERTINEGVEVVKEGEIGREFYIIESGRVEVTKKREGDESEVVGLLGKGDHFGELALLNSAPRAATVRAIGGRLRVAALGEKAFTRLLGPVIEILSRHAESHYGQSSIKKKSLHHPISTQSLNSSNGVGTFGNWNANQLNTHSHHHHHHGLVGNLNSNPDHRTPHSSSSGFQDYRLDSGSNGLNQMNNLTNPTSTTSSNNSSNLIEKNESS